MSDRDPEPTRHDPTGPARASSVPGGRWYRRGTLWLAIVVLTAAAAWVLAGWADDQVTTFAADPDAPAVAALCAAVPPDGLGIPADDDSPDHDALNDVASAAHEVAEQAPEEIESDAAAVADVLADAAASEDPVASYEQGRLEHRVAFRRVHAFVLAYCGQS